MTQSPSGRVIATEGTMATELRLGALGQVSLDIRDVARATHFYHETLGLPHVFTFGDLAFFEDGEGNTLAIMSRVPAGRA